MGYAFSLLVCSGIGWVSPDQARLQDRWAEQEGYRGDGDENNGDGAEGDRYVNYCIGDQEGRSHREKPNLY